MENIQLPLKMRGENQKFRWRRLYLAKRDKAKKRAHRARFRKLKGGRKPYSIPKRSMHVSWKRMNLLTTSGIFFDDKPRRPHCRQGKYLDDPLKFGSQVYSDAPSNENSGCKNSSGQGMAEARDNSSLTVGKRQKSKKDIILEAPRNKKKVHFPTLIDICHLKNAD